MLAPLTRLSPPANASDSEHEGRGPRYLGERGGSKPEAGSDSEHYYAVLAAHGFKRRDMMAVRLVHLADAARRKELMVIYREPLPPGTTPASLAKGGKDHAKWAALKRGLIGRAERSVTIAPLR